MIVENYTLQVSTKAVHDMVDITDEVAGRVKESGVRNGTVCIFSVGSTAGVTTVEYENGLKTDVEALFQRLAPTEGYYEHNERWNDGNGFSHVSAALLKPSLTIPIMQANLRLGTWQQVVVINFDNRPRDRIIAVQVTGI